MKQYQQDRENPDNIKQRNEIMKSRANKAQPRNKKMSIAALAKWHDINLSNIVKKKDTNGL